MHGRWCHFLFETIFDILFEGFAINCKNNEIKYLKNLHTKSAIVGTKVQKKLAALKNAYLELDI